MAKTLWVSIAQVATAVVVYWGCITASRIAPRPDSPDIADGVPFFLAAMLLTPLGAMIIGPLVAEKLGFAKCGVYSLSALAVFVLGAIGSQTSDVLGDVTILSLILTTLNLALGYATGIRPERPRRS